MTDEQAHAVAVAALADWGGAKHPPQLIGNRENAVFRAQLADGAHVALRLHRPGYQSDAAIRSELVWMQLLAGSGFRCCAPVATLSGALTARSHGRVVSAVGWLNGAPLGASGVALTGSKAQQVGLFTALGAMIARAAHGHRRIGAVGRFRAALLGRRWFVGPDAALGPVLGEPDACGNRTRAAVAGPRQGAR